MIFQAVFEDDLFLKHDARDDWYDNMFFFQGRNMARLGDGYDETNFFKYEGTVHKKRDCSYIPLLVFQVLFV